LQRYSKVSEVSGREGGFCGFALNLDNPVRHLPGGGIANFDLAVDSGIPSGFPPDVAHREHQFIDEGDSLPADDVLTMNTRVSGLLMLH
jgi:hypothetical protein